MTRFIGIDLAWSERNLSGFTVLEWDRAKRGVRLVDSALVHSDEDIRHAVALASGEADCLLAIDGPIIAPNEPGTSRACDKAVTRDFGRFHAGAYPANRERSQRPVRLRKALQRDGYSPDPHLPSSGRCRRQLEIFPPPGPCGVVPTPANHQIQEGFGRRQTRRSRRAGREHSTQLGQRRPAPARLMRVSRTARYSYCRATRARNERVRRPGRRAAMCLHGGVLLAVARYPLSRLRRCRSGLHHLPASGWGAGLSV